MAWEDRADAAEPEPDVPEAALLPSEELEFVPAADAPVPVSAQATPYPVENTAAPTPRATANPPTRPTNLEAPISPAPPCKQPLCLQGG
ncbi:hypothetical protein ACXDF8_00195 [Mycolicibacterium sp. CBM1]